MEQAPQSPHDKEPNKEREPVLLARVTLARHEETHYTGEGRDITPEGEAKARERGRMLLEQKGTPTFVGHSPQARAKGTAEALLEGMGGVEDFQLVEVKSIRQSVIRDVATLQKFSDEFGVSQQQWADAHHYRPDFYNNEEFLESNQEKLERIHRGMALLLSRIIKGKFTNSSDENESPHLLFVSHYELLTLLLDEVFGLMKTFGSIRVPTFGEHIDIDVLRPIEEGAVPLVVGFRDHQKEVVFDIELRRFRLP